LSAGKAKGVAFVAESSEPEPQAVVTPLTTAAVFLVVTVSPGGEETVRGLLEDMSGLQRAVGFRIPGVGPAARWAPAG
jgi:porphyrinogen peroxidase